MAIVLCRRGNGCGGEEEERRRESSLRYGMTW